MTDSPHPLILAITGASGVAFSVRLLETLLRCGREVHLTISPAGKTVMQQELGVEFDLESFDLGDLLDEQGRPASHVETPLARALSAERDQLSPASTAPLPRNLVRYFHHGDFMAPMASGSFLTSGMVVCPCSGGTLSAIVYGSSDNLIQRAADVHLKEQRKLIVVNRETPLSTLQLDNMKRACDLGATVLPAMPGWYHGVTGLTDLVDFVVSRILDQLNVPHSLTQRWGEGPPNA